MFVMYVLPRRRYLGFYRLTDLFPKNDQRVKIFQAICKETQVPIWSLTFISFVHFPPSLKRVVLIHHFSLSVWTIKKQSLATKLLFMLFIVQKSSCQVQERLHLTYFFPTTYYSDVAWRASPFQLLGGVRLAQTFSGMCLLSSTLKKGNTKMRLCNIYVIKKTMLMWGLNTSVVL